MWISRCASLGLNRATRLVLAFCAMLWLFNCRELRGQAGSPESVVTATRPQLVVLVDVTADQEKVFAVEQSLALDVVRQLGEKGFLFSLMTFGVEGSRQIESGAPAEPTLNAIRKLTTEVVHKDDATAVKLYEALAAQQAAFSLGTSGRAILVISGGQENLDVKRLKQINSTLHAHNIVCHVAIVYWRSIYVARVQVRGFYLHDLAHSTHGKYVEVGKNPKKVPAAVQKLVERILQAEEFHVR